VRQKAHATFFFTVLVGLLLLLATQVRAHDWYSYQRNLATGQSCCNGRDCFPLAYDQFYETEDEYVVTLKNFALMPFSGATITGGPGRNVFRIKKEHAQPTPHMHPEQGHTGYFACVWGGKLRCFFYPSFS
jgi:hypothetical protein